MFVVGILACRSEPEPPPPGATTEPAAVQALVFDGAAPTNLLMISLDTMRRDHVGRYHDGPSPTPFLDARMAEGFTLDDWMACSNWTVACTACVLSGASNLDRAEARGMVPILVDGPLAPIPRQGEPNGPTPLLPGWLRDHGYRSLLVSANGYFGAAYGNAQGYDTILVPGPVPLRRLWEVAQDQLGREPLPEPWFLHLHSMEPHAPYLPDAQYLAGLDDLPEIPFDLSTPEGQARAEAAVNANPPVLPPETIAAVQDHFRVRYAGEVQRYDDGLREVWGELEAAGRLDDTLVVFWTDHGEAFWEQGLTEHGKLLHPNENDAVAWFWARNLVPGSWDGPTEQRDLVPTILALFGFDLPPEVTGTPIGLAPDDRVRFALTDAYRGPVQSVRKGSLSMQFRWESVAGLSNVALYDRATDPDEQHDLFDPASPDVQELWALLRPQIESAEPWIAADPRGYDVSWPDGL